MIFVPPQFRGVIAEASNIGHEEGNYTPCMFYEDFPQFVDGGGEGLLPDSILAQFIEQANASIQPDKWFEQWRYACGLYVAHYATLYLRTYKEFSPSATAAADTGSLNGIVKRAQLGDSSVEYDTAALTSATEKWGDLNATQYGQLLASKARLVGLGGTYVL